MEYKGYVGEYKRYVGNVEFDDESSIFRGEVINMRADACSAGHFLH